MLKRENRLDSKKLNDLKKIKSVQIKTALFNAKIYQNNEAGTNKNKIAIIIPKKNLTNANKRNLLKRRISFVFNKILKTYPRQNNIKTFLLYYMLKDAEQKVPKYSIIEKQIQDICGTQS